MGKLLQGDLLQEAHFEVDISEGDISNVVEQDDEGLQALSMVPMVVDLTERIVIDLTGDDD